MKNIVLIAPPAAGKGTQSKKICETYHVPHISTGDLLREIARQENEMGTMIKKQMELGNLIDDETMVTLLKNRLSESDCKVGYILDGFPRNITQGKLYESMLQDLNKKIDLVIVLDLDYETAKKRITGRIICPRCGHVFNDQLDLLKPQIEGTCDICKASLIKRNDDTEEVFLNRYETYQKETEPLISYYEKEYPVYKIDSSKDADIIFEQIRDVLERDRI